MPSSNCGTPPPHFSVPANNSGQGNVLKIGRGVSVYWDLQPPNTWLEHQHPTAQIVLALDPVDARMTWGHPGSIERVDCSTTHAWFLPHDTPHGADWRSLGAMLVFYVERDFIREECHCELTRGAVVPLLPLIQQDYLVSRVCRKFHDLCHRKRTLSEPLALAGATLLAASLLHACLARTTTQAGSGQERGLSEKRLEVVANYIEAHLRDPLTPAALATAVGMSEHHFSRLFRISTGRSPMKYVWRCRVHRARQLLESGECKVAGVAADTGFCDQSHLDRQFRKEFGCSPGSVIPPAAS